MRYGLIKARTLREVSTFFTEQRLSMVFVNLEVGGRTIDPSAVGSLVQRLNHGDEVVITTVTVFDSVDELLDLVEACRTKGATLTSVDEKINNVTGDNNFILTSVKRLVAIRNEKVEKIYIGRPLKSLRGNFFVEYLHFRGLMGEKIAIEEAARRLGISSATFNTLTKVFEGSGGDVNILDKQADT